MPAWSFKRQFQPALANGLAQIACEPPPYPGIRPKRQTIRKQWVNGKDPRPGQSVRVWIAQRTPGRVFLGETPPITRAAIDVGHLGGWRVDTVHLSPGDVTTLARRDGFETADELLEFVEAVHGFPFFGYRFRW